jgi:fructose-bisphosphate aldolase class I|tara:strand:+ start:3299 stop:4573 length:1275 start_codon:yes stop_codon:yes gene_type:complete
MQQEVINTCNILNPSARSNSLGMAAHFHLAVQAFQSKSSINKNGHVSNRPYTRILSAKSLSSGVGSCHGGCFLSDSEKAHLEKIAAMIGTPGKGITACDEGPGTIGDRFAAVGIENTEENRRSYRQILFESPGCEKYLSAAILDPETLYQKSTKTGDFFPDVLTSRGIVPGVKPHLKAYALPGQARATVMQGLDSLAPRLAEYKVAGCEFAKWRSPLEIDLSAGQPSDLIIQANMRDLARYALICQAEGLVPIVEPDISLQGDHDLETAVGVNVKVQSELFKAMLDHGVFMEGSVLKSNMVNPGKSCQKTYTVDEIAQANLVVFRRCLPTAITTANFLSGGQSLEDAAARLNAINSHKGPKDPWNLSFSWSAALQMPLFQLCKGKNSLQLEAMSELYLNELAVASAAARGEHIPRAGEGDHSSG